MKTFKEILEKKINQKDYKFYVIITGGKDAGKKAVGKIESGWEFKEDAQDQVAEIKSADRITAKVLTKQGLKNQGLNPDDNKDWVAGPMNEKEGAMQPFLSKMMKALDTFESEFNKSQDIKDDNVVSPGELRMIRQIKDRLSKLKKMVG
jgi:hypothetical protein